MKKHSKNALLLYKKMLKINLFKCLSFKFKKLLIWSWPHLWLCHPYFRTLLTFFDNSKALCERCAHHSINSIVAGKRAKLGEYPYMALLRYRMPDPKTGEMGTFYLCDGSLINKWYVLTAAHCIKNNKGEDLTLT